MRLLILPGLLRLLATQATRNQRIIIPLYNGRSPPLNSRATVWIRQIYEVNHLRDQRVVQCLVRCSHLMHQHRAQLPSSTADAKPGTGIDAARPGICSTSAAGRPGAANRVPEFRGLGGSSTAGIRRPTWAPTTSSAQQFPGCSRSQARAAALCSRRTTGLQGTDPQSLTLHHLVAMSRANTSARRRLTRVSASPQLRVRVPSMLCP